MSKRKKSRTGRDPSLSMLICSEGAQEAIEQIAARNGVDYMRLAGEMNQFIQNSVPETLVNAVLSFDVHGINFQALLERRDPGVDFMMVNLGTEVVA